jgi:hypothetical protein
VKTKQLNLLRILSIKFPHFSYSLSFFQNNSLEQMSNSSTLIQVLSVNSSSNQHIQYDFLSSSPSQLSPNPSFCSHLQHLSLSQHRSPAITRKPGIIGMASLISLTGIEPSLEPLSAQYRCQILRSSLHGSRTSSTNSSSSTPLFFMNFIPILFGNGNHHSQFGQPTSC